MVVTREKLEAVVWIAADDYFRSEVSASGYLDNVETVEDLAAAILSLQKGNTVGITVTVTFVYLHDRPITEPWEETTRTSRIHVEVKPNRGLDARVVLEWGAICLLEPEAK